MGLGDDLMWLGEAAEHIKMNPASVIHDGREWSVMWKHHDWVVSPTYDGPRNKIHVPRKPGGNRWYIEGWAPGRIIYKNYQPKPAPYIISHQEREQGDKILKQHGVTDRFVIVNPDSKNTTLSSNKDWGIGNWQSLIAKLAPDIQVVRIKPPSNVTDVSGLAEYDQPLLDGAINIQEDDVRVSFAIMSRAQCIITTEGGLHHFAAAINMPAFVIYGGAIHPDQTGYKDRSQTYYVDETQPQTPCGSQRPCNHCRKAMDSIKPSQVYEDVTKCLQS
jgi:ADP-heptose:LPS heptosyltransferase